MDMIIDAHQHYWKISRNDYDWLTPELSAIYRDFLPDDLRPVLEKNGVAKTIVVQAAPTVEETQFLLGLAQSQDNIAGVVGWVDMEANNSASLIAALGSNTYLKAIRPMIQDITDDSWMLRPQLASAFQALIDNNLCFDALVLPRHLEALLTLLLRYPSLPVVIDHAAKPDIAGQEFDVWAEKIQQIAEKTSAYCKISGLLTEAGDNISRDCIAPYVEHLFKCFGSKRLIWGSDWPVLNMAADYDYWINQVHDFIRPLSKEQQAAIMGGNAVAFYQL